MREYFFFVFALFINMKCHLLFFVLVICCDMFYDGFSKTELTKIFFQGPT